jgi:hypothetical protein
MSPESENFDKLRQLLVLKRHEQPPPGYFNRFSGQVIARIEAGENGEARSGLLTSLAGVGWMQRLWTVLDRRPLLAGGAGLALCAAFAAGVIFSEKSDSGVAAIGDAPMSVGVMQASAVEPVGIGDALATDGRLATVMPPGDLSYAKGSNALQAGALFQTLESLQAPRVRQANFSIQQ